MFKRFSAPTSSQMPLARKVGRLLSSGSAHPSIGRRAFSKPERIYFRGMAWAWGCGVSSISLTVFSLGGGGWLPIVVSASALVICTAKAFDARSDIRDYFRDQIEHATTAQTELHLDNAALRQELEYARRSIHEYRGYIEILAAGQGAEGDELCGESPSARNVFPFRRMH